MDFDLFRDSFYPFITSVNYYKIDEKQIQNGHKKAGIQASFPLLSILFLAEIDDFQRDSFTDQSF